MFKEQIRKPFFTNHHANTYKNLFLIESPGNKTMKITYSGNNVWRNFMPNIALEPNRDYKFKITLVKSIASYFMSGIGTKNAIGKDNPHAHA